MTQEERNAPETRDAAEHGRRDNSDESPVGGIEPEPSATEEAADEEEEYRPAKVLRCETHGAYEARSAEEETCASCERESRGEAAHG